MAVPKHLEEAVARLKDASLRIDQARAKPSTVKTLREWLEALTDYSSALSDVHTFNNESIHEKLHELAERVGVKGLRPPTRHGR